MGSTGLLDPDEPDAAARRPAFVPALAFALSELAAGGDDNRVVFVKRREAGGCDGMQMVAFYDTTKTAVAELPAYLGFATIPGDVCAAAAATPPAS
jgi:hypothetical protein